MKELVEFTLEDGSALVVEGINDLSRDRRKLVSASGENEITRAEKTLKDAIDIAKSAAESVLTSFKEMNSPNEINLEFGIKLAAKTGIIIASADTEANFRVSLKWKKQD